MPWSGSRGRRRQSRVALSTCSSLASSVRTVRSAPRQAIGGRWVGRLVGGDTHATMTLPCAGTSTLLPPTWSEVTSVATRKVSHAIQRASALVRAVPPGARSALLRAAELPQLTSNDAGPRVRAEGRPARKPRSSVSPPPPTAHQPAPARSYSIRQVSGRRPWSLVASHTAAPPAPVSTSTATTATRRTRSQRRRRGVPWTTPRPMSSSLAHRAARPIPSIPATRSAAGRPRFCSPVMTADDIRRGPGRTHGRSPDQGAQ
jgi:hypothetical protein